MIEEARGTTGIVLAHGFTQTARSWSGIVERLARVGVVDVTAVDLPGHGSAIGVRGDLWDCARHLLASAPGDRATFVGYSMGGRIALHAALLSPHAVGRLVLVGATPGIEDDRERAARRRADERLADRIEEIGTPAFIDEWLKNPLFAGLTPDTDDREDRLRNDPSALAQSLRSTGTGTQTPLWNRLDELTMPVELVVGEDDPKFREIAERMRTRLSDARLHVVEGAGHSVHLEQADRFVELLSRLVGG